MYRKVHTLHALLCGDGEGEGGRGGTSGQQHDGRSPLHGGAWRADEKEMEPNVPDIYICVCVFFFCICPCAVFVLLTTSVTNSSYPATGSRLTRGVSQEIRTISSANTCNSHLLCNFKSLLALAILGCLTVGFCDHLSLLVFATVVCCQFKPDILSCIPPTIPQVLGMSSTVSV